jgi:cell division protein FtsZ
MPLTLSAPETTELKPRILVFGVGGAGGNAVNNMIDAELEGVDFAVANTDAQALARSGTERRIQMGAAITEGLGAGARPEVGEQSAEDSIAEISEYLQGAHMVFITAGMGGGTGTGRGAGDCARGARAEHL